MLILAPAIVEVKPADLNIPTLTLPADLDTAADDFGPPDDSPLWDAWADEATCQDRLDAGLCPF